MANFHLKGLEIGLKSLLNVASAPSGTPELRYMSTAYTPNPDNSYWSDISSSEASGAPTITISGLTVTMDTTNNRVEIDFTDPSTASITTVTNQFVIIVNTGVAATSPIVFSGSIGTTLSPTDGTLALTLNAEGIAAQNAAVA
jgi:hypothetical protein